MTCCCCWVCSAVVLGVFSSVSVVLYCLFTVCVRVWVCFVVVECGDLEITDPLCCLC